MSINTVFATPPISGPLASGVATSGAAMPGLATSGLASSGLSVTPGSRVAVTSTGTWQVLAAVPMPGTALDSVHANHNSIATAVAANAFVKADAARRGAKQAAPPRGIPR